MSRVFVTGSSTGLGLMAGQLLADKGHQVVLHARDQARADETREALPLAEAVVVGDISSLAGMRSVAEQVNNLGPLRDTKDDLAVRPASSRWRRRTSGHVFPSLRRILKRIHGRDIRAKAAVLEQAADTAQAFRGRRDAHYQPRHPVPGGGRDCVIE
jgi:nucleoside-diphosphate-sugar epimerase